MWVARRTDIGVARSLGHGQVSRRLACGKGLGSPTPRLRNPCLTIGVKGLPRSCRARSFGPGGLD